MAHAPGVERVRERCDSGFRRRGRERGSRDATDEVVAGSGKKHVHNCWVFQAKKKARCHSWKRGDAPRIGNIGIHLTVHFHFGRRRGWVGFIFKALTNVVDKFINRHGSIHTQPVFPIGTRSYSM